MTVLRRLLRAASLPAPALVLASSLLGCSHAAVGTLYPARQPPRFEAEACHGLESSGYHVDCGTLRVPERRGQARTREVRLAVAIVRSNSAAPTAVPALFLPGGPGEPCLEGLALITREATPVLAARDLIVMDYRGVGRSQPALGCDQPGRDPGASGSLSACRDVLEHDVDLTAYKTADVAADLADLVHVLGYEKVNLIGNSYGTRVALTLLRDHAPLVQSAVLDAPVPLEVNVFETLPATADRALGALAETCASQASCAERHPRLDAQLDTALANLGSHPAEVALHGEHRPDVKVRLTPGLFTNLILQCFAPRLLPALPAVIGDAASGKFDALVPLLETMYQKPPATHMLGAYESVQCSEELPFNTAAGARMTMQQHPRFAGLSTFEQQTRACAGWPIAAVDPRDSQPVTTDAPVLLLSGRFDPIVDPRWAAAAQSSLRRSRHLVFDNAAHGALHLECGWKTAESLFADPEALSVDACVESQPTPVFWDEGSASGMRRALQMALSR